MDQRIKRRKAKYEQISKHLPSTFGLFKAQQHKHHVISHLKKGTLFNYPSTVPTQSYNNQFCLNNPDTERWIQKIDVPVEKKHYEPEKILSFIDQGECKRDGILQQIFQNRNRKKLKKEVKQTKTLMSESIEGLNPNEKKKITLQKLQSSGLKHPELCRRQKMKPYFKDKYNSSAILASISIFKKMKGKKADFKYRTMEKSIKSLHESVYVNCSDMKKIYPEPEEKKIKKNRESCPLKKKTEGERGGGNDFIPMFLAQKILF